MHTPASVSVPDADQLPFINEAFHSTQRILTSPSEIPDSLVKVLKSWSQESLESLMAILQPKFDGRIIRTSGDLDAFTIESRDDFREYFVIDPDHDNFTDSQLKVFLLIAGGCEQNIDWRKFSRLYNAATYPEKKAISSLLHGIRPIDLNDLVNTGLSPHSLPDALLATQTKEVDGETFVYCEIAKDWLRDDLFHKQFMLSLFQSFTMQPEAIAYAGTLEQAIAKATTFTLGKNGPLLDSSGRPRFMDEDTLKRNPHSVYIHFHDGAQLSQVAGARLSRRLLKLPDSTNALDCQLQWGSCKAPFAEKDFRKALYATEKLFGVQWSKVHNLEDALGL
jgi:hypothetical protein